MTGVIKSFSPIHGYGFISAADKEIYFHAKDFEGRPRIGSEVEFKVIKTDKGYRGIHLKGVK